MLRGINYSLICKLFYYICRCWFGLTLKNLKDLKSLFVDLGSETPNDTERHFYFMKNENYFVIQGWMINELKLKGNDLLVFSIIYGFSQDGETEFTGSIKYLCECLSCSRPTVSNSLKTLCESGLIIKSDLIVNGVLFHRYKISLQGVKNFYGGSKETLQGGSKISLHNNTINNNIVNSIDIKKKNFGLSLTPFVEKYGREMLANFYNYWTEPNKSNTKLRFENEKFWDLNRRLSTWVGKEKSFAKKEKPNMRTTNEVFDELINGGNFSKPKPFEL